MGTYFTREPKIKRAPTKIAVSVWMQQTTMAKKIYYGYIEEIWQLDYGTILNIPLFRCQWVKLTGGGITKDQYRMTIVDLNDLGYRDEPFILAKDVAQVFYVKDMSSKPKKGTNR
jgi:hypothetical protein